MKNASIGQIGEIVAQLVSGQIGSDRAQIIIEGRMELPPMGSIREQQARKLFRRFGSALGCETFEAYLEGHGDSFAPVPQIPTWPAPYLRVFGRENICLVDRRVVDKIGLMEYCRLAGLAYGGNDDTFEAFEPKQVKKEDLYWMLYQDGYRNRNRKPADCRTTFAPFEVGMDAIEGIGVYTQNPDVIIEHYLDLPGSVHRGSRGLCACLGVIGGSPKLGWRWGDGSGPGYGSASRGE